MVDGQVREREQQRAERQHDLQDPFLPEMVGEAAERELDRDGCHDERRNERTRLGEADVVSDCKDRQVRV